MKEKDKISIESLNSNKEKKDISLNDLNSNEYCDFEYNIDEILKSKNWINENNINISKSDLELNKNYFIDYKNYFTKNKIGPIKRTITLKDYNNNKNETSKSFILIENHSKSEKSINFNNKIPIKNIEIKNKKIKEKILLRNKVKNINKEDSKINKNVNKIKSINSEIIDDFGIKRLKGNRKNKNIVKEKQFNFKELKKLNNIIDKEEKINKNKNGINMKKNSNLSFNELYKELEKEINYIKSEKNQAGKISEQNIKIIDLLSKINNIFTIVSEKEGKYKNIFKQILDKINYYISNKNNYEIINLLTQIEEKQNINISLKKEYQKLMNNKIYKINTKINERKQIEYKEILITYENLNKKINKMKNILSNLRNKVKIYKEYNEQIEYENNIEYIENKLKEDLKKYDNIIEKLKEERLKKEEEFSFFNYK